MISKHTPPGAKVGCLRELWIDGRLAVSAGDVVTVAAILPGLEYGRPDFGVRLVETPNAKNLWPCGVAMTSADLDAASPDLFAAVPANVLRPSQPMPANPLRDFLGRRRCARCGSPKAFFGAGVDVFHGRMGTWFCSTHWREGRGP